MRDALPDDWETQVERAYEVFGIEPDAAEFGRLWQRIKGRAIGHVQHAPGIPRVPLDIDFERLHPRNDAGRWEFKPRAHRDLERARGFIFGKKDKGGPSDKSRNRESGGQQSWSERDITTPIRPARRDPSPGRPSRAERLPEREREPLVEPRPLRYSPETLWELNKPEQPSTDFQEVGLQRQSSQEDIAYDENQPGRVFEDSDGWRIQQPGSFLVDRGGQRWTARTPDGEVVGYFGSASEAEEAIEEAKRGYR